MLAAKDEYLQEAAETIFQLSADDLVRKRCRDREEYYQDLRNYERAIAEREEMIERDRLEHEQDLRNYKRVLAEQEQDLRNYENALAERDSQIQQLLAEIEALKTQN